MTVREAKRARPLETGDVFFVYRPQVDEEDVAGLGDVQRLFLILEPKGGKRFRRIVVGRKQLPEPEESGAQRFWGFVEEVERDPARLDLEREAQEYETKTRGARVQPEDRPVAEGVYSIVWHEGHTHLTYELELPRRPGGPQREFNLEREASYVVSVKNPRVPSPRGAGLQPSRQAELPRKLQRVFASDTGGERRFVDLDPPDLLDQPGVELVFIAASGHPHAELGVDLEQEDETPRSAETVRQLGLDPEEHPTRPLFEREWE